MARSPEILVGSTPFRGPTDIAPVDARLSPQGGTPWVVDSKFREVIGFRVRGGGLAELPSSPTALPGDAAPFGIVVT